MKHGHHHQSAGDRGQNADDAAAKLQFLDWCFLDNKGQAASLLAAGAAERSEQPAGVVWFMYGPEWPESSLLYQPFHRRKRDRLVGVISDIVCAPVCIAKLPRMLHSAIRVAVRSGPMEGTPLLSISHFPCGSGCRCEHWTCWPHWRGPR